MAKKKFYQTKMFDMIHVPNIIMKVKPYLYCTKREKDGGLANPDAEVKVIADVWLCVGTGETDGWRNKSITADYIPRCEVDLENNKITKHGEELVCVNMDSVIEVIRQRVFETPQESAV